MGFAVLLVSHDLAVIRQLADRVAVMYLGRIVESAPADALFENPAHPYTRALLSAVPGRAAGKPGGPLAGSEPPSLLTPPPGCVFHTRCPEAMNRCSRIDPPEFRVDHAVEPLSAHRVHCLLHENTH
jgi:oligopeptide/dipeptide ABC transporter ATP-binding protein